MEIDQEHGNVAFLSPWGDHQWNRARLLIQHGGINAGLFRVIRYTISNYSGKDAQCLQIVFSAATFFFFSVNNNDITIGNHLNYMMNCVSFKWSSTFIFIAYFSHHG